ncbi:MAG: gamma-glutamyl-gamma-aminobutyrate hydrolase family protein [Candidatus Acidiferrales bacterium]
MGMETNHKVRVGIPYRTRNEELRGERVKYDRYAEAVRLAGGEPVEISLGLPAGELKKLASSLDAFVLTGSPADVEPAVYHAARHPKSAEADADRERTDFALLDHAFTEHKPVLAICYGVQSLNVFLGGSLIQHISSRDASSEIRTNIPHPTSEQTDQDFRHSIRIESGTRIAGIAQGTESMVNSSHHQAIREPGRGLRVVAHAPDGVIEAVEWTGDSNWVTGVQWHPERMAGTEALALGLFHELVAASVKAPVRS